MSFPALQVSKLFRALQFICRLGTYPLCVQLVCAACNSLDQAETTVVLFAAGNVCSSGLSLLCISGVARRHAKDNICGVTQPRRASSTTGGFSCCSLHSVLLEGDLCRIEAVHLRGKERLTVGAAALRVLKCCLLQFLRVYIKPFLRAQGEGGRFSPQNCDH